MSDTRRWVQPGWSPVHRRWSELLGNPTPKHQARDHRGLNRRGKRTRFTKGIRASSYVLREKLAERRGRESWE